MGATKIRRYNKGEKGRDDGRGLERWKIGAFWRMVKNLERGNSDKRVRNCVSEERRK